MYQLAPHQDLSVMEHFSVSTLQSGGALVLESELDYEEKRLYQVVVEALDRASLGEVNTAQATIIVEVPATILSTSLCLYECLGGRYS